MEYLGTHETVYVACIMPNNSAVKIPFHTNTLHSALTASTLLAAVNVALRESHCSSSLFRGNNRRHCAANPAID